MRKKRKNLAVFLSRDEERDRRPRQKDATRELQENPLEGFPWRIETSSPTEKR